MKYKNKDGISLNYGGMSKVGRKGSGVDLTQEVILKAIDMLEKVVGPSSMPIRAHQNFQIKDTITFLKENFDLYEVEDFIGDMENV